MLIQLHLLQTIFLNNLLNNRVVTSIAKINVIYKQQILPLLKDGSTHSFCDYIDIGQGTCIFSDLFIVAGCFQLGIPELLGTVWERPLSEWSDGFRNPRGAHDAAHPRPQRDTAETCRAAGSRRCTTSPGTEDCASALSAVIWSDLAAELDEEPSQ